MPRRLSRHQAYPALHMGLRPPFVHSVATHYVLHCVRTVGRGGALPCEEFSPLPQRPSFRSGFCCPSPSPLNRPHPPRSWAHLDFAALRFIRDAFAVLVRLGDPRVVPCFRCAFLLGMPSSSTTGNPLVAFTQFFTNGIGLRQGPNGSALPSFAIIRFRWTEGFRGFTGSLLLLLLLRPVELLVFLADLTGASPSQPRLLLPSFPSSRSPFSRSDMTTVATEQFPPMGLPPIGTSASIAAKVPSLHRSYPASSVLRTSPPPHTAQPVSHELPVDPHCDHRWGFPCCLWSPMPTCHRHYPGRYDGACSLVSLHYRRPSLCNRVENLLMPESL